MSENNYLLLIPNGNVKTLNEKFRELITKYHYKLIGFNMPLPPPIYEKDIQK